MTEHSPQETTAALGAVGAGGTDADRLDPLKERVRAALDVVSDSTRALPRMDPMFSKRLRKELVRLMEAGQARDAFDQRTAHIEAALARAGDLEASGRAAVETVVARQLMEISAMLEQTAKTVSICFRAIKDAVADAEEGLEAADDLMALARRGFTAASDLAAAAEVLGAEAAGYSERIDAHVPAEAVREADLDWMFALYTMDEERSTHRLAIAQYGLVA